jgi:UDP-3-O-[3-hydroxymyristoyl] glucosamine N-acyltransferase
MKISVNDLAARIGGHVEGDGTVQITGIAPIPRAKASDITFADSPQYCTAAEASAAGAMIVPRKAPASRKTLIRVENPRAAFARALAVFFPPRQYPAQIHPTAQVGARVRLGNGVFLGEYAVVRDNAIIGDRTVVEAGCFIGEGAVLGADCVIHPGVKIHHRVRIGQRVVIKAGAVIGGDGFGYVMDGGQHLKIPQVGDVVIEDDVEIGSNTTIDRAMMDSTVIGRGTKIDNLVQIGHNVTVGQNSILISQVGVSGSVQIGTNVTLAGQVGVADHVKIGDNAVVAAQGGIAEDVPPKSVVWGTPAQPMMQVKRQVIALRRLPALIRALSRRGLLDAEESQ